MSVMSELDITLKEKGIQMKRLFDDDTNNKAPMSTATTSTYEIKSINSTLGVSCGVCGEFVPLTDMEEAMLLHGHRVQFKICEECRKTILYMRKKMQRETGVVGI